MRSDVTCVKCKSISTTLDPFFDISLELPKRNRKLEKVDDMEVDEESISLLTCLSKFTSAEQLESSEKFMCTKCNSNQECIKQLSIQHLPNVICFHLKRFEYKSGVKSKKIDNYIQFPDLLDMSQYLTDNLNLKIRIKDKEKYILFAVVNHIGSMETGHYTSFVKYRDLSTTGTYIWIKCDDSSLTKIQTETVMNSKAYLLFYVRANLEYENGKK